MARDLKLTATLIDKVSPTLKTISENIQKVSAGTSSKIEVEAKRHLAAMSGTDRARLADNAKFMKELKSNVENIQREVSSLTKIATERTTAIYRGGSNSVLTIQKRAAIEEASLVLDKFDRRISIEKTKHAQSLVQWKGNDEAIEAEIRRHNAVVSRISMDKANLPNTPFQQLLGGIRQGAGFQDGVAGLVGMTGVALGATVAFTGLKSAISASMDAAMQVQSIKQALDFVSGSAEQGAKEFEFLTSESMRLGLSIKAVAPDFGLLAAAAKDTKMQGQGVRDLFTGMAEASTVLHLSTEQTSGAINAFQQMLSKGKVQAQEMNLQLGNALPGSLNIAARAMGVTKSEFVKMMSEGNIYADEFLPKMAAELHKTFGDAAVTASENARQSIQKFNNAMFESASVVGEVFVEAAGKGAKAYLAIANSISTAADAQQRFYAAQTASLSPVIEEQLKKENATRVEGLRLAKDAKAAEDQKAAAPTQGQQSAIEKMAKEDKKAAKFGLELKHEYERARIESTEDGAAKEIAIAEEKYKENFAKSEGYYKNEKLALEIYNAEVDKIHKEAAQKQWDTMAEQKNKVLASQREFQAKVRAASKKERDEAVARDEDRTNKSVGARDALESVQDKNDPVALLKAQKAKELDVTNLSEKAKFDIKKRYELLTEDLQKQAYIRSGAVVSQGLSAVMGLYHHHGAEYKVWAEAKNAVDTALSAQAAYESAASIPYVGFIMAPVAAAAAIAVGAENAASIKSAHFYGGGYTGSGNPWEIAGQVHKDEYVVPHDTLSKVGGPSGMERMLQGEGGGYSGSSSHSTTIHAPVSIHLSGSATPADGSRIADAVEGRIKGFVDTQQAVVYRGGRRGRWGL